jgi:hypothetical protein
MKDTLWIAEVDRVSSPQSRRAVRGFRLALCLWTMEAVASHLGAAVLAYDGFAVGADLQPVTTFTNHGGLGWTGDWTGANSGVVWHGPEVENIAQAGGSGLSRMPGYFENRNGAFARRTMTRLLKDPVNLGQDGEYFLSFSARVFRNNCMSQVGLGNFAGPVIQAGYRWGGSGAASNPITLHTPLLPEFTGNNIFGVEGSTQNGPPAFFVLRIVASAAGLDEVFLRAYHSFTESVHADWSELSGVAGGGPDDWHVISSFDSGAVLDRVTWRFEDVTDGFSQIDEFRLGETWQDVAAVPHFSRPAFVAFNDHATGAGTSAHASELHVFDSVTTRLKDIGSGVSVPVQLSATRTGAVAGASFGLPNAGTPADTVFSGFVDFGGNDSPMIEVSGAAAVSYKFTGLIPSRRYRLQGSAVRGDPSYVNRWTLCELAGAISFSNRHSSGVLTAGLPAHHAALNTGVNLAGDIVDWDHIQPGPSGTLSLLCRQYTGPIPGGTANGSKGYALTALRFEELPGDHPPVSLRIRRSTNGNVQVNWPGPITGHRLQFTPALGSPSIWNTVETLPVHGGGTNSMHFAPDGPRFFRLSRQ